MSGDVMAAFAELGENYPGSKQKRRAVAAPAAPSPEDAGRWDARPTYIEGRGGVKHEFFAIGALALALGRRPVTIRKWIENGVLPKARFVTDSVMPSRGSRRLWTRTQIEGIARIAREEGLIDTSRHVGGTEFTVRVKELWRVLRPADKQLWEELKEAP